MGKIFLIVLTALTCLSTLILSGSSYTSAERDSPTVIMHDTIADPGVLTLQIDAFDFTGDNGQISAITLNIDIDTLLVEYISIQNTSLTGNWVGNYNTFTNEIVITYVAPFGTGYDIDGKLLDMKIYYFGGFSTELEFKPNCEITNVNLQTITNVLYDNGYIEQSSQTAGKVYQDSVIVTLNDQFSMPVFAEGDGYDMVNEILFRVGYDTSQIQFIGIMESALTNINVADTNSVITASWSDPVSPVDLTIEDTLFFLDFVFIGDTNTSTEFLAGSFVFNNDTIVSTEFSGGYIIPRFPITLLNSPDTAGTALGEGIYFINDTVTITAIPEEGFYFSNWTYADTNVLSNDSLFSFQMDPIYDTITANYIPFSFDLSLIASPPEGGELIGEGTYPYGQTVMVYAVPSPGYYFMYWLFGNDTLSANPEYSFIMPNNNIELIGSFAPIEYNIVTNPNNPDYGTAEGGGHYYYGDTAEIVATPFAGYEFIAWTENGQVVSYDSAYSVIVYSDHEYIANFQAFSTCPAPVGLYGVGMDETSAMLFWTPAGSEEEWDLIWGETGFDTLTGGNLVEGLTDTELLLEGLDPGTMYDFYVRAVCDGSFYSNWSLPYTFVTWYVSIAEKSLDISIYPNPTIGKLFLISNINKIENINYTVCDIYGKQYTAGAISTKQNMYIDLSEMPNGLYFLRLNASEYSNIVSVIKH